MVAIVSRAASGRRSVVRSDCRLRHAISASSEACAAKAIGKNHELCLVLKARPNERPVSAGHSQPLLLSVLS
jgi:hypothetical protein